MATIEIFVSSSVRPTERVDRVVTAIENIFPGLVMDIRTDRIEAYDGSESLRVMHDLLRRQKILDAARSEMLRGLVEDSTSFRLNKQAALMGIVSFPAEEEALGSLHIRITGGERVIDWLAPRTENGAPILETDLAELAGSGMDDMQKGERPDDKETRDV
jgi:predicted RNA binding protein with dsRBD fold (UPF0201 family)